MKESRQLDAIERRWRRRYEGRPGLALDIATRRLLHALRNEAVPPIRRLLEAVSVHWWQA